MRSELIVGIAVISSLCSGSLSAKPMASASLEEAVRSPHIVLVSYQTHEQPTGRSDEDIYLSGLKATYKLESVLKQTSQGTDKHAAAEFKPGTNLNVRYLVHDLSPCMADRSFHFSKSLLPSKGSKWILFLNAKDNDNVWQTYRGSEGRLEATDSNVKKVKALLNRAG